MVQRNFPNCCTMKILSDLGGTAISDFGNKDYSTEDIKIELLGRIKNDSRGMACFVVATNNEQKNANRALKELGFKHSKWMSKDNHPETKVRLWWYPIKK